MGSPTTLSEHLVCQVLRLVTSKYFLFHAHCSSFLCPLRLTLVCFFNSGKCLLTHFISFSIRSPRIPICRFCAFHVIFYTLISTSLFFCPAFWNNSQAQSTSVEHVSLWVSILLASWPYFLRAYSYFMDISPYP